MALQEVREDLRILSQKKREYSFRNSFHSNLSRTSNRELTDVPLINNLDHRFRFHQTQQPPPPPLQKRQTKSNEISKPFNATIVMVNHKPRDPETVKTYSRIHTSSGFTPQANSGHNHQGSSHTTVQTNIFIFYTRRARSTRLANHRAGSTLQKTTQHKRSETPQLRRLDTSDCILIAPAQDSTFNTTPTHATDLPDVHNTR